MQSPLGAIGVSPLRDILVHTSEGQAGGPVNWDCATPAPHCLRVAPEVTPGISAFPYAVHAPALCTPLQLEKVLRRGRAARGEHRSVQQGPAQLLSKLGAGSTEVY